MTTKTKENKRDRDKARPVAHMKSARPQAEQWLSEWADARESRPEPALSMRRWWPHSPEDPHSDYPHEPLYSSSIHLSHQNSLLYTQFFHTHPSSISSSIHCGAHMFVNKFCLNISMWDLVFKNLLKQI
jgi:hypothetical protein